MEREPAFSEYVAARRATLFRTACLLCGDPHRAEDIVQNTLARLYANWPPVSRADNVECYVRRMLVQEILTNSLKHSQDKSLSLLIRRTPAALRIRAVNVAGPRGLGSGLGLLGMAERVSVFGGTLSHGRQADRYVVEADLPLRET